MIETNMDNPKQNNRQSMGVQSKKYKLGGLEQNYNKEQVEDTLIQIDGVKKAEINTNSRIIDLQYDAGMVTDDHLKSTMASLGYGILEELQ